MKYFVIFKYKMNIYIKSLSKFQLSINDNIFYLNLINNLFLPKIDKENNNNKDIKFHLFIQ